MSLVGAKIQNVFRKLLYTNETDSPASVKITAANNDEVAVTSLAVDITGNAATATNGITTASAVTALSGNSGGRATTITAAEATAIGTNTTNITSNDTDIATNVTNIASNDTDIATNVTAIALNTAKVTYDGATQVATNVTNIATNVTAIALNTSKVTYDDAVQVATNVTNIASNDTDIATNVTAIALNTAKVTYDGATQVATNVTNIATNVTAIASNDTDIATNATNISGNDTDIATNVTAIALNTAKVTYDGASQVATNVTNIATNATNISSNDTDIATNATAIALNTTHTASSHAPAGAEANVDTDLSANQTNAGMAITSSTGDDVDLAAATASAWGVMTDEQASKLENIAALATVDQSDAEIRAAVEAATDSNVFTDADHTKLNGRSDYGIANGRTLKVDEGDGGMTATSGQIARFTGSGIQSISDTSLKTQLNIPTDTDASLALKAPLSGPTFTGIVTAPTVLASTIYFGAETANVISGNGVTLAITWATNQKQKLTITGAGATVNFTNPAGPCNLTFRIIQGNGDDTITTWDSDIKWVDGTAPTLSTASGAIDILSFYFDGTNYYGVASLAFA